jgi:hypothetical protein
LFLLNNILAAWKKDNMASTVYHLTIMEEDSTEKNPTIQMPESKKMSTQLTGE